MFKTRIHELRKERKMSQQELADAVGVRRETIGKLENGMYNPSLFLSLKIARLFERPVEDIFLYEPEEDE